MSDERTSTRCRPVRQGRGSPLRRRLKAATTSLAHFVGSRPPLRAIQPDENGASRDGGCVESVRYGTPQRPVIAGRTITWRSGWEERRRATVVIGHARFDRSCGQTPCATELLYDPTSRQ